MENLINSISGGATSSFMYVNYPAPINIFSCVLIEDERARPKDKGLCRAIEERIPSFIASAEVDTTLKNVLDLEDRYGHPVTWINGPTFEEVINFKKMLPNRAHRFCTYAMKIEPIFKHCFSFIMKRPADMVEMAIGFRYDERIRAVKMETTNSQGLEIPFLSMTNIGGKTWKYKQKHKTYFWRNLHFPLIDDKITKADVYKFWQKNKMSFPIESNCAGCFFKNPLKLQQQWKNYPKQMKWFSEQEEKMGATFRPEGKYKDFKNLQPTLFDLDEETGFACNCTD